MPPCYHRSIGLYVFRPAAMAMGKLGLQLAAAIALAGLARSQLPDAVRWISHNKLLQSSCRQNLCLVSLANRACEDHVPVVNEVTCVLIPLRSSTDVLQHVHSTIAGAGGRPSLGPAPRRRRGTASKLRWRTWPAPRHGHQPAAARPAPSSHHGLRAAGRCQVQVHCLSKLS